MGNIEIEKVENYKYLGCLISSNLKWIEHIHNVKMKISKLVPIFYKIRHRLMDRNKLILYNALIKPHLQYAITVYSKTTQQNITILQKLQNKKIRILFKKIEMKT